MESTKPFVNEGVIREHCKRYLGIMKGLFVILLVGAERVTLTLNSSEETNKV